MKVVVTVVGLDRVGIIAEVSKVLAEKKVNILSINQSIIDGFFNMVLIADAAQMEIELIELQAELQKSAEVLNMQIFVQHADIFYAMHRV